MATPVLNTLFSPSLSLTPVNNTPSFSGLNGSAPAKVTTLTFDELADGTTISTQYQALGVTASGVTAIYAPYTPFPANSGANFVFAATGLMTFSLNAAITGSVQTVSAYVNDTMWVGMYAYDAAGVLVAQAVTPGAGNNFFLSLTSFGNPIASVSIHDEGSNFTIDTLKFDSAYAAAVAIENGPAVVLGASVQISDAELDALNNYNGASLTLVRHGGASTQDQFSAKVGGSLAALTEGAALVVDGTNIGSVTSNSAGNLLLSFNSNASHGLVNSALQQIAYANSSDAPPASVLIDWNFNDGNAGAQGTGGALLAMGSTTVTITPVNDPAVITGTSTAALTETNAPQSTGGTLVATDPDSSPDFTVQTAVPGSNSFGNFSIGADGVWTYTMSSAHDEFVGGTTYTDTLLVSTADGTTRLLTVNILGTNESVVTALFTSANNTVNFNTVLSSDYTAGTQYNGLGGNDGVTLAGTLAAAAAAGYDSTLAFHGGAGDDTITGGALNDTIYGDANNDTLIGGAGNDFLNGGSGNDTYKFGLADGNDTLVDSSGTDAIVMTAAINALNVERTGNNLVINVGTLITVSAHFTDSGNVETLQFAAGSTASAYALGTGPYNLSTKLTGGSGNDIIAGTGSGQTLNGGNGNDLLFGNGGNDTLIGGAGNDLLDGGAGSDTASYTGDGAATAGVTVSLAISGAQNTVGAGLDSLVGIENITGSSFGDRLTGNAGANTINGGAGADTITGGGGNDLLNGGTGNDTFVFAAGFGNDTIIGFDAIANDRQDKLNIAAYGYTAANVGKSAASAVWIQDTGDSIVVHLGGDSITLVGVNGQGANTITAADFLFA